MRVCAIHPQWRVLDSEKHAHFFLAQHFLTEYALKHYLPFVDTYELASDAVEAGHQVILDNGVYEKQPVTAERLIEVALEIAPLTEVPRPIVVPPDTWDDWEATVKSFKEVRQELPGFPLMLVLLAPRNGVHKDWAERIETALELEAEWVGIPINVGSYMYEGQLPPFDLAKAGPESLRAMVLEQFSKELSTLNVEGVGMHLLGLGWDWWHVGSTCAYRYMDSIDSAKPADYAMIEKLMVPNESHHFLQKSRDMGPLTESKVRLMYDNAEMVRRFAEGDRDSLDR